MGEMKNGCIFPIPRTIWVVNGPPRICPQSNGNFLILLMVLCIFKVWVVVKNDFSVMNYLLSFLNEL